MTHCSNGSKEFMVLCGKNSLEPGCEWMLKELKLKVIGNVIALILELWAIGYLIEHLSVLIVKPGRMN